MSSHRVRASGCTASGRSCTMRVPQPLVTAVVVCYNHARFVAGCLDSVRSQTYPNLQLLIMDDASCDGSPRVIRDWIASHAVRCDFVAHGCNRGLPRTLNEALRRARGEYVAFLAADDLWLPDKTRAQVGALDGQPDEVGVIYSDAALIDEAGRDLPGRFIETYRHFPRPPEGDLLDVLLDGNFIPAMTTLVRRSCWDAVGRYDESLAYEDWDMWLRIARRYRFAFLPEITARYRVVHGSLLSTLKGPRRGDLFATHFRIFEKCLRSGTLRGGQIHRLRNLLTDTAEALMSEDHPHRTSFALRALRYQLRLRTLGLAACSLLGVPHARWTRAASWLGRCRGLNPV